MTPREHHAKHCESRGLDRMAPFERCPFRSWHVTETTEAEYGDLYEDLALGSRADQEEPRP